MSYDGQRELSSERLVARELSGGLYLRHHNRYRLGLEGTTTLDGLSSFDARAERTLLVRFDFFVGSNH